MKKRKLTFLFILSLSIYSTLTFNAYAKTLVNTDKIDATKQWTIKMNKDLDNSSITNNNIYVENLTTGEKLNNIKIETSGSEIHIIPNNQGYNDNTKYRLVITENVKSKNNKNIKEKLSFYFETKDKNNATETDELIKMVQDIRPSSKSDLNLKQIYDSYFSSPKWEHIKENGEDTVRFTGYNASMKIVLDYIKNSKNKFEISNASIDKLKLDGNHAMQVNELLALVTETDNKQVATPKRPLASHGNLIAYGEDSSLLSNLFESCDFMIKNSKPTPSHGSFLEFTVIVGNLPTSGEEANTQKYGYDDLFWDMVPDLEKAKGNLSSNLSTLKNTFINNFHDMLSLVSKNNWYHGKESNLEEKIVDTVFNENTSPKSKEEVINMVKQSIITIEEFQRTAGKEYDNEIFINPQESIEFTNTTKENLEITSGYFNNIEDYLIDATQYTANNEIDYAQKDCTRRTNVSIRPGNRCVLSNKSNKPISLTALRRYFENNDIHISYKDFNPSITNKKALTTVKLDKNGSLDFTAKNSTFIKINGDSYITHYYSTGEIAYKDMFNKHDFSLDVKPGERFIITSGDGTTYVFSGSEQFNPTLKDNASFVD